MCDSWNGNTLHQMSRPGHAVSVRYKDTCSVTLNAGYITALTGLNTEQRFPNMNVTATEAHFRSSLDV